MDLPVCVNAIRYISMLVLGDSFCHELEPSLRRVHTHFPWRSSATNPDNTSIVVSATPISTVFLASACSRTQTTFASTRTQLPTVVAPSSAP